ncbi:unnamed protein product [Rotaria magnacalcarata]|uniref:Uncharacterized protein n=1 Tax=Rotaria magnacalcarata TaxID=392030 RepID=A0A816YT16_9BILA|nr:unnamed protein product [Rotaria magnacalcarata]CAF2166918.1 unnamed protein product [Rotaria magnacalcarata]
MSREHHYHAVVTAIKQQQYRSHKSQRKVSNTAHVTQVKAFASESTKKSRNNVVKVKHINTFLENGGILSNESSNKNKESSLESTANTRTTLSQDSSFRIQNNSNIDSNLQQPMIHPLMDKSQDIKNIQRLLSIPTVSKTMPLNDYNLIDTVAHSSQPVNNADLATVSTTKNTTSNSKSFSFETDNFQQLHSALEVPMKTTRYQQLCPNRSFVFCLILPTILILLFTVTIVVPVLLLLPKTTVTIQTILRVNNARNVQQQQQQAPNPRPVVLRVHHLAPRAVPALVVQQVQLVPVQRVQLVPVQRVTTSSSTTQSTTTSSATTTAATVTITSNACTANWTGISMIANCINCSTFLLYYNYVTNYTAIGSSSRIVFSFLRSTGFFALDDVSVRSATAPSVEILVNGGFESGNLTGWSYCNQNSATNTGGVKANSSNFTYSGVKFFSNSGSYYYVGGGLTVADYLSHTFPTITGQIYTVGFWIVNSNNATLSSADLFLGV